MQANKLAGLTVSIKHNAEKMPKGYIEKYCKRCYYYTEKLDYANELNGIWDKDLCYTYCWRRNAKGKVVDNRTML